MKVITTTNNDSEIHSINALFFAAGLAPFALSTVILELVTGVEFFSSASYSSAPPAHHHHCLGHEAWDAWWGCSPYLGPGGGQVHWLPTVRVPLPVIITFIIITGFHTGHWHAMRQTRKPVLQQMTNVASMSCTLEVMCSAMQEKDPHSPCNRWQQWVPLHEMTTIGQA